MDRAGSQFVLTKDGHPGSVGQVHEKEKCTNYKAMCSFLLQVGLLVFQFQYEAVSYNKAPWYVSSDRVLSWCGRTPPQRWETRSRVSHTESSTLESSLGLSCGAGHQVPEVYIPLGTQSSG